MVEDEPRLWYPWRPPRRRKRWRVLWAVGMVVAVLTTALLIVHLHPEIWKDLLEGRVLTLVALGFSLTAIVVMLAIAGARRSWTGIQGKTVWDFLQLLIVPLMLVAIGFWFTAQQDARQQKIEKKRAEAEQELAVQRAQDEALQAYLNQMGGLLLEKDLFASDANSEVSTLARARTATVIQRLDSDRNRNVIRFLKEAGLIGLTGKQQYSIRLLAGTDLRGALLEGTDLRGCDLSEANLSGADLSGVDLFEADLSGANLNHANLDGADLPYANLSNAKLSANLSGAKLSNAKLSNANLSGADLSDARMFGVEGITKEELEKQTSTLEGAIMPDGSVSSVEFEPALSVSLSEEWEINEVSNQIYLYGKGGYLIFSKPRHVFDPSNPSEQKEVPAPENVDEWVSWFQSHPNLETSKPVPESVGGASGMRIAVALTSTPENYPQEVCQGTPCVPLYPLGHGAFSENMTIDSEGYTKYRFNIVDVGGETVVIPAIAKPDKFDEFLPKAQKVLDTVKWQE